MVETTPESTNGQAVAGRTPRGTFAPGNKIAKGNPQAARMHALRSAMLDAIDPEKMKAITVKVVGMAEAGDMEAFKLILQYAVGRPPSAVELTGPEGEPLGLDWAKVQAAVLAALAPFGSDAKIAVALALKGVASESP